MSTPLSVKYPSAGGGSGGSVDPPSLLADAGLGLGDALSVGVALIVVVGALVVALVVLSTGLGLAAEFGLALGEQIWIRHRFDFAASAGSPRRNP